MFDTNFVSIIFGIIGILSYFLRVYYPKIPPPLVIAIDLGTTFSSGAVFNNGFGNITILHDDKNRTLIPSTVTFYKNGTIIVGEEMIDEISVDSVRFYDSKRYIGLTNIDQDRIPNYPFDVKILNGSLYYVIPNDFKINKYILKPIDISYLIIEHLKRVFKLKYGYFPTKAVIGVPVEFDNIQRETTIKAAEMANLKVLRLVNEPTAASMACDVHIRNDVENVVVLDLGGGTFDVAIISSIQTTLSTLAIAGNERLGGRDFTNNFLKCIIDLYQIPNNFTNKEYFYFLQNVEKAKIELSSKFYYAFVIQKNGVNFNINVSLDYFEECNSKLFNKLITPINLALQQANLTSEEIHEIVLVGGATRMTKIHRIVKDIFNRLPNNNVNPDIAVVIGLANTAGVITEGWPLDKLAIDIIPQKLQKIITN